MSHKWQALILVVVMILSIWAERWIFQAVMGTEWPEWVKYIILR